MPENWEFPCSNGIKQTSFSTIGMYPIAASSSDLFLQLTSSKAWLLIPKRRSVVLIPLLPIFTKTASYPPPLIAVRRLQSFFTQKIPFAANQLPTPAILAAKRRWAV